MENYLFQLDTPIEYSKDGEFVQTATIELLPPSADSIVESMKLSQFVMQAFTEARKNTSEDDLSEEDMAAIKEKADNKDTLNILEASQVQTILFSSKIDLSKVFALFKKLMMKVGKLDKDFKPIKEAHFRKFTYDDTVRMMCEYIANFIIPSLF